MRLEKLHLVNFKNYAEATVDFVGNVHCFLGANGGGKTNLLEAIHYLGFTKGSIYPSDPSNVRHGQQEFQINGLFEKNEKKMEVSCAFSLGRRKAFLENGKEYNRFSEHIGKYPLVLVAPNDIELIWDGGEVRRKFFDSLLAQVDPSYLEQLIIYQAHLRQRNGLLRMSAGQSSLDLDLIDSYDEKIVAAGNDLHHKRASFVKEYVPLLSTRYNFLTGGLSETVDIQYVSDLEKGDFKKELQLKLEHDRLLGRTSVGIHRDDFVFTLNGYELKRYGSQGQQKSFLIALKFAEFDHFVVKKGTKPLVLLDDIFDKLDDSRTLRLMKLVSADVFGQIFITDASPGRSSEVLKKAGVKSQNFIVDDGSLIESR